MESISSNQANFYRRDSGYDTYLFDKKPLICVIDYGIAA